MRSDHSKWSKLTLGEDEEVETRVEAKVYDRVLFSPVRQSRVCGRVYDR
jgi:hypothetical protein